MAYFKMFLKTILLVYFCLDDYDHFQQMLTLPVSHIMSCSSSNFETKLKIQQTNLLIQTEENEEPV